MLAMPANITPAQQHGAAKACVAAHLAVGLVHQVKTTDGRYLKVRLTVDCGPSLVTIRVATVRRPHRIVGRELIRIARNGRTTSTRTGDTNWLI